MAKILNFNRFGDTLRSFVSALGGTADKSANVFYDFAFQNPVQLAAMYKTSWVARKIVNIPPFDAFREWRSWQAEEGQIELLEYQQPQKQSGRKP